MHRHTIEGGVSYFEQVVDLLDTEIDKIGEQLDELYEKRSESTNIRQLVDVTNEIRTLAIKGNALIDDQTELLKQIGGMK